VHKGVALLFQKEEFPLDVLTLTTVNFVRKYLGYTDVFNCGYDEMHYFSLTPYHAMQSMALHHSQFVWFRKLFTIFSRYAYINSFELFSSNPEKYKKDSVNKEKK
jgi:N-acetylglucosaminylphosphatidylinositol deacetylase